ncbi:TIGR01777 family oxidoreductase [Methylocaldum sp.]|uniref:TIGR01777 family oxidoreductase n=1 Tax=Methylocaldum sp. TaxID=1969727 RepID=UPI002D5C463B|nr:TIGR01777 family oxidoreductase [Methylocaldum sp.]HYE34342.1 TIGR01777 family oxidoreductase [Methylocaldum sp.]
MRVFVTGGTGFIGRNLCKALLRAGYQLTVLSRKPETVSEKCGPEVTALKSLANWSPDQHFDAVINLAGAPIVGSRWTGQRKQVLWDSRVTLTEHLIDTIRKAESRPGVLISGSAVGIYGNQGDAILDENSVLARDDFGQKLCWAWEDAALRASEFGVRVCLLRTGLVIGKDGGFLQKMLLPFKLGLGGRLGDGKQWMSWVHMKDHVAMTQHLLESPNLDGAFNVTAPNPVTNEEFTQCMAKVLKRPALLTVPAWLLRLGAGEMAELMLGGQRALPRRFQGENFKFSYESLEPALRDALL